MTFYPVEEQRPILGLSLLDEKAVVWPFYESQKISYGSRHPYSFHQQQLMFLWCGVFPATNGPHRESKHHCLFRVNKQLDESTLGQHHAAIQLLLRVVSKIIHFVRIGINSGFGR